MMVFVLVAGAAGRGGPTQMSMRMKTKKVSGCRSRLKLWKGIADAFIENCEGRAREKEARAQEASGLSGRKASRGRGEKTSFRG
jgi:hypothetical protein